MGGVGEGKGYFPPPPKFNYFSRQSLALALRIYIQRGGRVFRIFRPNNKSKIKLMAGKLLEINVSVNQYEQELGLIQQLQP